MKTVKCGEEERGYAASFSGDRGMCCRPAVRRRY